MTSDDRAELTVWVLLQGVVAVMKLPLTKRDETVVVQRPRHPRDWRPRQDRQKLKFPSLNVPAVQVAYPQS